jgi:CDP-glycerol glycerophosphotransferase
MKQLFRRGVLKISRRFPAFRKLARAVHDRLTRASYRARTRRLSTDAKLIVFASIYGRNYAGSPKAVYEYMRAHAAYRDFRFIWAFEDTCAHARVADERTDIVVYGSPQHIDALGRAGYWIADFRVFEQAWPRADQVYAQCWHGKPFKRTGFDVADKMNAMNSKDEILFKYRVDAERFTYIVSPSPFATEKLISGWGLKALHKEHCVIEVGYPRDDRLVTAPADESDIVRKRLGLPPRDQKSVVLYAPTWRDDQYDAAFGYQHNLKIDFDRLRARLGDDYIVLVRIHYLVHGDFDFTKYEGFVRDVSDYDDIYDLFLASDLLVTDYSTVAFDFANLRRPMVFYMYDLERYERALRGFYFDIDELPGPIVHDESRLADAILQSADGFIPEEKYERFNAKHNPLEDGHSSERFVKRVIG